MTARPRNTQLNPASKHNWDRIDADELTFIKVGRSVPKRYPDGAGSYTEVPETITEMQGAMSFYGLEADMVFKAEDTLNIGDFILVPLEQ